MERAHANWVIYMTLVIALALHLIPLPFDWRPFRPPLAEMVLCYWVLALPYRVGIITSATLGLALDLLEGAPTGAQSLGLVFSTLIVLLNYQRIRQFDPLQQIMTIVMLIALSRVIERWAHSLVGLPPTGIEFLLPLLGIPLLWPPIFALLRDVRREWSVA